ncbi:chymotrypsin-elastase inhibitor ixodidin-like [Aphidius gifuensis]|uniref:chymotrypsin-elastase inhibitor ixodidin-like n=1 Tax=Aphidius gifuensis TaxID=684658 RepID=UPI001CDC732E|nr:chymotrypsin-elastase inhibitor ixodidin-like [Aphidius gifuensis]
MSRLFFYFVIISAVFAAGINAQGDILCEDENEVPTECGKACELICPGKPRPCPKICVSGCVCIEGYARTDKNGYCVPISRCGKSEAF